MNCYCCSSKKFSECCQPFLEGEAKPQTAKDLMRSRYSAYATRNVQYLLRSTHPSTRNLYEPESIKEWAESNQWQQLEIVLTSAGTVKDKKGTVEFKAYFVDREGVLQIHHESSNFIKELGKWFFVDGKILNES